MRIPVPDRTAGGFPADSGMPSDHRNDTHGKRPSAIIPRELSQLAFNARVLQEARDGTVPLLERLGFLGIFSSNQDEYYRVRVAALQRVQRLGSAGRDLGEWEPAALLADIQRRILSDQKLFLATYDALLAQLEEHGIRIVTENELSDEQGEFVRDYFVRKVRPHLTPIMLERSGQTLNLDERDIYLGVRVQRAGRRALYAIVGVPTRAVGRFVRLPSESGSTEVILLEDVIRFRLPEIFSIFQVERAEGYVVKITRDSGLDLGGKPEDSYLRRVEKSVRRRLTAALVRFVFDEAMPDDLLDALCRSLRITDRSVLVPGGRHHNFKDFIRFPHLRRGLRYRPWPALPIPAIDRSRSVMQAMRRRDILIQTPYQPFAYLIDLLREAAIDPKVSRIAVTMYRVADNSGVVNALINAARNGKKVTAVVELTARFDETTNIEFTEILAREGVRVVLGPEELKIHAKMGLIERREQGKRALYGFVGTGNLNEDTGALYADHFLLTTHKGICQDLARLFRVIRRPYEARDMDHLLVAPWTLRQSVERLIRAEIERARRGETCLHRGQAESPDLPRCGRSDRGSGGRRSAGPADRARHVLDSNREPAARSRFPGHFHPRPLSGALTHPGLRERRRAALLLQLGGLDAAELRPPDRGRVPDLRPRRSGAGAPIPGPAVGGQLESPDPGLCRPQPAGSRGDAPARRPGVHLSLAPIRDTESRDRSRDGPARSAHLQASTARSERRRPRRHRPVGRNRTHSPQSERRRQPAQPRTAASGRAFR